MDEDFRKKIAEDFGLIGMDFKQQNDMIEKIGNMLFEIVIEKAIDVMDDQTVKDFDDLISQGSDYNKVVSFLKNRVNNFGGIVSEEMSRLRRTTSGIFA